VVTGKADLKATTKSRAVDGRNHWHRQLFQLAQWGFHLFHVGKDVFRVHAAVEHLFQITAREEGLLGRGDDNTGEAVFSGELGHQLFHALKPGAGHGVCGLALRVKRDRNNAAGVFFVDIFRHGLPRYTRSMMDAMPMPPPTHMVISARFWLRRSSSSIMVDTSMPPVAPSG